MEINELHIISRTRRFDVSDLNSSVQELVKMGMRVEVRFDECDNPEFRVIPDKLVIRLCNEACLLTWTAKNLHSQVSLSLDPERPGALVITVEN